MMESAHGVTVPANAMMSTHPKTAAGMEFAYLPWWDASNTGSVRFSFDGYSVDDLIAYVMRTQKTFYDADLLEYVAMVGPKGGLFLDVGANIGNHAVFFATFCADHVVAFEPNPALQGILTNNLRRNQVADRTTVIPVGLSDREGTGSMDIRAEHKDNIGASHVARGQDPIDPAQAVNLRPLDAFTFGPTAPWPAVPLQFMKIDVEGMEMDVLRGAAATLRDHRPQILVELITEQAVREASDYLATLGYKTVAKVGDPPSYHFIDTQRHVLRPNLWSGSSYWSHMKHTAENEVRAVTPDDAVLVMADADDLASPDRFAGRSKLAFMEQEGRYSVHPATAQQAIDELERLRAAGATFFVLSWAAFWYLDIYPEFRQHLEKEYRRVCQTIRVVVYEL